VQGLEFKPHCHSKQNVTAVSNPLEARWTDISPEMEDLASRIFICLRTGMLLDAKD
jgi:hypothetical protein